MCVCAWIFVCVFMCMCTYMCAKYSDFLCIWLRKCDFLTEKLGIGRIRNDLFRIRILQKVPDPQHCL